MQIFKNSHIAIIGRCGSKNAFSNVVESPYTYTRNNLNTFSNGVCLHQFSIFNFTANIVNTKFNIVTSKTSQCSFFPFDGVNALAYETVETIDPTEERDYIVKMKAAKYMCALSRSFHFVLFCEIMIKCAPLRRRWD